MDSTPTEPEPCKPETVEEHVEILDRLVDPAPAQPSLRRPSYVEVRDRLEKKVRPFQGLGNPVLEHLCRENVLRARLALFTDYIRMENSRVNDQEYVVGHLETEDRKIQPDLSKYANAMEDYRRIKGSSTIDFAVYMRAIMKTADPRLIEIAYRKVAVELYRTELGDAVIDQTKPEDLVEMEMFQEEDLSRVAAGDWSELIKSENRRSERSQRIRKERTKFLWKIGVAIFGGLALIVPMLIMVLQPNLITVTVTTSVSVLIVSFILAVVMKDAEVKDVVAATAAYAAVLVVFVGGSGDSTGNNSSGNGSTMSNGVIGGIVAGSIVGTLLLMMALFVLWVFIAMKIPGIYNPLPWVKTPYSRTSF